jgi:hypothetical protein
MIGPVSCHPDDALGERKPMLTAAQKARFRGTIALVNWIYI